MSDPSRRTRFEGRQGDVDATIRTHQHYRSINDQRKNTDRDDVRKPAASWVSTVRQQELSRDR
jgi:hypothetical protein